MNEIIVHSVPAQQLSAIWSPLYYVWSEKQVSRGKSQWAQSCLLIIIFQYQLTCMQYSYLSVVQPIIFQLRVVYASLGISNTVEDNSKIECPIEN